MMSFERVVEVRILGAALFLGMATVGCQHEHGARNAVNAAANTDPGQGLRTTGLPTYNYPTGNARGDAESNLGNGLHDRQVRPASTGASGQRQNDAGASAGQAALQRDEDQAAAEGFAAGETVGAVAGIEAAQAAGRSQQGKRQQTAGASGQRDTTRAAGEWSGAQTCGRQVVATSAHAVGEPCLTTDQFIGTLRLSATQQHQAEHLVALAQRQVGQQAQRAAH